MNSRLSGSYIESKSSSTPARPRSGTPTPPATGGERSVAPQESRAGIIRGVVAWDPREGGTCFLTKIRCSPTSSSGMRPSIS